MALVCLRSAARRHNGVVWCPHVAATCPSMRRLVARGPAWPSLAIVRRLHHHLKPIAPPSYFLAHCHVLVPPLLIIVHSCRCCHASSHRRHSPRIVVMLLVCPHRPHTTALRACAIVSACDVP
ncbi:hypothetical protein DENSPDRAFT_886319 [Dentipellis sp. KUC8613]|nr:hypothetical protein DENSPDRAFT_886319 [Dentipellis sp. KUC8613]